MDVKFCWQVAHRELILQMKKFNERPKLCQTICWSCANAVPDRAGKRGCTWSRYGRPVEGWTADAVMQYTSSSYKGNYGVQSYRVRLCPKFVKG